MKESFRNYFLAYERTNKEEQKREALRNMLDVATYFDEWSFIVKSPDGAGEWKSIALEKMIKTAKTLEQWFWIYLWSKKDSQEEANALTKIGDTEAGLEEWLSICSHASKEGHPKLYDLVLSKIGKLTASSEEWKWIFNLIASDPEFKKLPLALTKMAQVAKSFGEWFVVYHWAGDELKKSALEKMAEKAATFKEWFSVHDLAPIESELEKQTLIKIGQLAKTLRQWHRVFCRDSAGSGIAKNAFTKMMETGDYLEWLSLYNYLSAKTHEFYKEMVLMKIDEPELRFDSFGDWSRFYKKAKGIETKKTIWIKLNQLAAKFEHWHNIYNKTSDKQQCKQVLVKMIEAATNFKESQEAYEIAPSESEQKKTGLEKMKKYATDFDQWLFVFIADPSEQILIEMERLAVELDEKLFVYKHFPKNSALKQKIFAEIQKTIGLEEWEKIYTSGAGEDELIATAIPKMIEYAQTFEEWKKIAQIVTGDGRWWQLILNGLVQTAKTMKEWENVTHITVNKEINAKALCEMTKIAESIDSFDAWYTLLCRTYFGSDLENLAFAKVSELAAVPQEWLWIWKEATLRACWLKEKTSLAYEESQKIALAKAKELAGNLEDWIETYEKSCFCFAGYQDPPSNKKFQELALEKVKNFQINFEEWKKADEECCNSEIKKVVSAKMFATAASFNDWFLIYQIVPGDETKKVALAKITELQITFEKAYAFYKDLADADLKKVVLVKMAETAATLEEMLIVYQEAEGDISNLILDKINAMPVLFEKWLEIYKANVNSVFNKVRYLAEEKMFETAASFEDCLILRKLPLGFFSPRKLAAKFAEKVKTFQAPFEKWLEFMKSGYCSDELEKMILVKMTETATAPQDWLFLCKRTPEDSEIKKLAFSKIGEASLTPKEWLTIYKESGEKDKLKELAFKKMSGAEASFEQWDEACTKIFVCFSWEKMQEMEKVVLKKMSETAANFKQWITLFFFVKFAKAEKFPDLEKLAQAKMQETAKGCTDWLILCSKILPRDSEEWTSAFTKALETAATFDEWLNIYCTAPFGNQEIKKLAVSKMSDSPEKIEGLLKLVESVQLVQLFSPSNPKKTSEVSGEAS